MCVLRTECSPLFPRCVSRTESSRTETSLSERDDDGDDARSDDDDDPEDEDEEIRGSDDDEQEAPSDYKPGQSEPPRGPLTPQPYPPPLRPVSQ